MDLIHATLPPDHELNVIACTHVGNPHQHEEGILEYVDYVARGSNRKAIIVGDIIEGINHKDKRWESGSDGHVMTITEQLARAVEIFCPIRNKILVAGRGNHETAIHGNGDVIKDIFCRELKIPYGTVSFKLTASDPAGKFMYKGFFVHPHGGTINSTHPDPLMRDAAEKSQLKRRLAKECMGDCILNMAAHYHKAIVVDPYRDQQLYLVDNGEKIQQEYIAEANPADKFIPVDLRWYASIPGWVKKYGRLGTSGYVERAGLSPLPLGYLRVTVRCGMIVAIDKVLIH